MKLIIKILLLFFSLLVAIYYGYMYILPSVTVVNQSGVAIMSSSIQLPNNYLDFGKINNKQQNTLYYSLSQQDGDYQYVFILENGEKVTGRCGYVTNNQIHLRATMIISQDLKVACKIKS